MRILLIATLLSGCVGFVEYDPTKEQGCEQTSATILFPGQVTEDSC